METIRDQVLALLPEIEARRMAWDKYESTTPNTTPQKPKNKTEKKEDS